MEKQERGGLLTPRGKHFAVPVRKHPYQDIKKSQRPREILRNPDYSYHDSGIYQKGKGRVYKFIKQARYKPVWDFNKIVEKVVNEQFNRYLAEEL